MFEKIVGQEELVNNLKDMITACKIDKCLPSNMLLTGLSGDGKTFIAIQFAEALNLPYEVIDMTTVNRKGLLEFLDKWRFGVVILDEPQSTRRAMVEMFLKLMDEKSFQFSPNYRKAWDHLMFIACTNEDWRLSDAWMRRLPIKEEVGGYTDENLTEIVSRQLQSKAIKVPDHMMFELGMATGCSPGEVEKIVYQCRVLSKIPDREITVEEVCRKAKVEFDGLSYKQRDYLRFMNAESGPERTLPASAIATGLGVDRRALPRLERLLELRNYIKKDSTYQRTITQLGMDRAVTCDTDGAELPDWLA